MDRMTFVLNWRLWGNVIPVRCLTITQVNNNFIITPYTIFLYVFPKNLQQIWKIWTNTKFSHYCNGIKVWETVSLSSVSNMILWYFRFFSQFKTHLLWYFNDFIAPNISEFLEFHYGLKMFLFIEPGSM